MPHFYFHVSRGGDLFEDRDGADYVDVGSAGDYGRRLARDLSRTGSFSGATVLVVDEVGREVARFPVDNVVELPRDRSAASPGSDTRHADPDDVRAGASSSGK
jgi:hypothetical protein